MTIGAVLIVKNEEVLLGKCLESLKGFDEIVVFDTGSTDKTLEIAKKYTDKVYAEYKWEDNFAKARNLAKAKATSDWILAIDADEFLVDVSAVREACLLAEQRQILAVDVFLFKEGNAEENFYYPRLVKNVPAIFWEGAAHNTVSVMGERLGDVRIALGYSPTHATDPDRTFRILKKQEEINPTPRNLYYLGREYSYREDWENCVRTLGRYIATNDGFRAQRADAFLWMARAYWEMKMPDDAKDACVQALKINPNFKEACMFMADLVRKDVNVPNNISNVKQWELLARNADNKEVLFSRKVDL